MLLSKHHGLGNDFLVALDDRNGRSLSIDGAVARALCDRRRGLGADGLIHGATPDDEHRRHGIDVVMHLYNADGGRAEMSGNGVRCLGQAVVQGRGGDAVPRRVEVLTDAGRRSLEIRPGAGPEAVEVSVAMGRPRRGPRVADALEDFLKGRHGTVDMGNPHLVILVPDPDGVDLSTEGAWLEQQFPHGVNVEYIAPDGAGGLNLRVWERGVGITEACGTGACAAAFEAHRWGLVGDEVRVTMPGGAAVVLLDEDGGTTLVGPSVFIADVEVAVAADREPVEA